MKRCGAVTLASVVVVGVLLVLFRLALPGMLERRLDEALTDGEDYAGSVGKIELRLLRAEAVVHDFHIEARSGRKVLKRVDLPVARASWRWAPLLRGLLEVDIVAEQPTVVIGTKVGPKEPDLDGDPLPEPGWFRFTIDAVPVDGTFIFRDLTTSPNGEVVLTPVTGTITELGTVAGPATFDLLAVSPGGGTVKFDAFMDFWNAHLDAFDMKFTVDDLAARGLPAAALAYFGTTFQGGNIDAIFGLTLDKGRRELPPDAPFHGGPTDDLATGTFRLELVASELVPAAPPIESVAADRVALYVEGKPVGDDPFLVRANIEGLDATVTRGWLEGLTGPGDPAASDGLPPIRLASLDVDGRLTLVDRGMQPPVEATAEDLRLRVREVGAASAFEASATVRGARVEGEGTVSEIGEWPTNLDLNARLQGVRAEAIEREMREYLGVSVERGVLDADAVLHARDGVFTGDATVYVSDLRFRESGWLIAADRAVLDYFDGAGTAEGVAIDPEGGGALEHITADRAKVSWSPEKLREGIVIARVEAHRPVVVVLERPGPAEDADDDDDGGGKVPWSLDVLATDGTVVWRDPVTDPPVEITIEEVDGTIGRLGTLFATSLWDLRGQLTGGGQLAMQAEMDPVGRDKEQPWWLEVAIDDAHLPSLQDEVAGYLGRQVFSSGTADARLSIVWLPGENDAPDARGRLVLDGHDLAIHDPPVDAISVGELSMDVRWDPSSDAPYRIVGESSDVVVQASLGGMPDTEEKTLAGWLGELPPFQVQRFTIEGGEIRIIDEKGQLPLDLTARALELTLHDLKNVGDGRTTVHLGADIAGGQIAGIVSVEPMSSPVDFHIDADLTGVPAVRFNDSLRAWANLDVDEGVIDLIAAVDATEGELSGDIRAVLHGVHVLELDDLKHPLEFLKSVAVGVLIDIVDHDDVATVTIPVNGTVAEPQLEVIPALLREVGRSFGIGVRADADAISLDEAMR